MYVRMFLHCYKLTDCNNQCTINLWLMIYFNTEISYFQITYSYLSKRKNLRTLFGIK